MRRSNPCFPNPSFSPKQPDDGQLQSLCSRSLHFHPTSNPSSIHTRHSGRPSESSHLLASCGATSSSSCSSASSSSFSATTWTARSSTPSPCPSTASKTGGCSFKQLPTTFKTDPATGGNVKWRRSEGPKWRTIGQPRPGADTSEDQDYRHNNFSSLPSCR